MTRTLWNFSNVQQPDLNWFKFSKTHDVAWCQTGANLIKMARGIDTAILVVVVVIIIAIIISLYLCCRKPSIVTVVSGTPAAPDRLTPSTGVRLFHFKLHCCCCYQDWLKTVGYLFVIVILHLVMVSDWLYQMPAISTCVHTRHDQSSGLHSGMLCQSNSNWPCTFSCVRVLVSMIP